MHEEIDVLIIGGGLVGAALMLALANRGLHVRLVEKRAFNASTSSHFDARTLALSPASVRILRALNVWPLLAHEATAIKRIHVSERGRWGTALLEEDDEPLGQVVELPLINKALHALLDEKMLLAPATLTQLNHETKVAVITHQDKTVQIKARLIVAADGGHSTVRQLLNLPVKTKDYHQTALIANIGLARPHHQTAYERFTATGPLAMLPMTGQRAAMVWCLPAEEAGQLVAMSAPAFLSQLQKTFGYRLGRLTQAGSREIFPLKQHFMPQCVYEGLVFAGNAAHTLHPVAGQGFNLGLRDAATLAQCILKQGVTQTMLQTYERMRKSDQNAIIRFTDTLIHTFGSRLPGMGLLRGAGLIALDNLSFLKQGLTRLACGYAGVVPDLACGIALEHREYFDDPPV